MALVLCLVASVTSVGLYIFPALIFAGSVLIRVQTVNANQRRSREELEGPGLR